MSLLQDDHMGEMFNLDLPPIFDVYEEDVSYSLERPWLHKQIEPLQNSLESSYGAQRGSSSLWSGHMQLLDAYVQNSGRSLIDSERRYSSMCSIPSSDLGERRYSSVRSIPSSDLGERRYSSVRSIPTSDLGERRYSSVTSIPSSESGERLYSSLRNISSAESWDYQPATVYHQISSYLNRTDNSSGNLNGQMESPASKSASSLGAGNYRDSIAFTMGKKAAKWDGPPGYEPRVGMTGYESSLYSNSGPRAGARTVAPLAFDELSLPSRVYQDALSSQQNSSFGTGSLWSRQPFEQFGVADTNRSIRGAVGSRAGSPGQEATSVADSEAKLLQSFRHCIVKLLKLEGSDSLFRHNDGADEDLIERVAAWEKILYEAETREINKTAHMGESQYPFSDRKLSSAMKINDANLTNFMVSSVPNCGEGCIWRADLIVSFGVWCIHRILDMSLVESRPELWGKYTYVLNRLQVDTKNLFSQDTHVSNVFEVYTQVHSRGCYSLIPCCKKA